MSNQDVLSWAIKIFIMSIQDILSWVIKIFIVNNQDFIMSNQDFYHE